MTDINALAARGRLQDTVETHARKARSEFTIAEFEEHFDELFARVEDGEMLTILHDNGQKVMMVPSKCLIGCTPKRGSH